MVVSFWSRDDGQRGGKGEERERQGRKSKGGRLTRTHALQVHSVTGSSEIGVEVEKERVMD